MIAIARNVLANSRLRGRVQDRIRRRLAIEPVELETATSSGPSASPLKEWSLAELVEALPLGERYAIKAHVVDERSYSEIAASLHCSEMVVRKRVSRGLARVRRALEKRS